jgi:hypothetical protein
VKITGPGSTGPTRCRTQFVDRCHRSETRVQATSSCAGPHCGARARGPRNGRTGVVEIGSADVDKSVRSVPGTVRSRRGRAVAVVARHTDRRPGLRRDQQRRLRPLQGSCGGIAISSVTVGSTTKPRGSPGAAHQCCSVLHCDVDFRQRSFMYYEDTDLRGGAPRRARYSTCRAEGAPRARGNGGDGDVPRSWSEIASPRWRGAPGRSPRAHACSCANGRDLRARRGAQHRRCDRRPAPSSAVRSARSRDTPVDTAPAQRVAPIVVAGCRARRVLCSEAGVQCAGETLVAGACRWIAAALATTTASSCCELDPIEAERLSST